jgi:voltage-gated potassium channel
MESLSVLYFNWFETFYVSSIAAFSVEYVLRFMIVGWEKPRHERTIIKDKLKYIGSNLAIIDLLAILPFYISIFWFVEQPVLLVMRLVVILKLTRYSSAMTLLMTVLRQEVKTFTATLFIMLVVALFSAGMIYLVESPYQPEKLGSIPEALYWTVITLTTIGYGDVAPVTPIGQFFTVFVAIVAIGITALPAGILASAISEYIRKTRKEYEKKVEKVLRDGKITDLERTELEKEGEALGIKGDDAEQIINYATHLGRAMNSCPHCGKPLASNKRKIRTTSVRPVRR